MFAGRGDIEDAFFLPMKDLGKAIGKLNKNKEIKYLDKELNLCHLK